MTFDEKRMEFLSNYYTEQILRTGHQIILSRNKIFEPYKLTGKQAMALGFICWNKDNNITQSDIVKEFKLRAPTINSLLAYLEDGGFITRKESPTDARSKIILPTQKSLDMFNKLKNCAALQEEKIMKGFSDEDKESLKQLFERINTNIKNNL